MEEVLTPDQQRVFKGIIQEMKVTDGKSVSLVGQAGVGKTYLTSRIIEYFVDNLYDVWTTTPAHKSLDVLRTMVDSETTPASTIHSFLGLVVQENHKNGTAELKAIKGMIHRAVSIDILLIDESSMISRELYRYINKDQMRFNYNIIYVGDPYQLPPVDDGQTDTVGKDDAKPDPPFCVFDLKTVTKYTLTKIMRQSTNNPIIRLASLIRSDIECGTCAVYRLEEYIRKFSDEDNIHTTRFPRAFKRWVDSCDFAINDDVVCSYTNDIVDMYDRSVHRRVCGKSQLYVNDYLIVQEPVLDRYESIVIHNSETVQIKRVEDGTRNINGVMIHYFRCSVNLPNKLNSDPININILKRSSIASYTTLLGKFAGNKEWKLFFKTKHMFTGVKYTYASTIHKLQGSTYNNAVYIDFREHLTKSSNAGIDFVFRLFYVAITRTRKSLYIYY